LAIRLLAGLAEKEHRSLAQQTLAVLARGLGVESDPARRQNVLAEIAARNPAPRPCTRQSRPDDPRGP
jgi:hypothetical protein